MNVGIIGMGLIGGSLGRAIVKKTNHVVWGYDLDPKAMDGARLVNAIHDELTEDKLIELDLLVFALYPKAIESLLPAYCEKLKPGCIVTDCCGNKREVVKIMKELTVRFPHLEFVGAHPMAGREFSGIRHSTVNLFDRASMILVPVSIGIESLAKIKSVALEIGFGQVVITTAEQHDTIIAFSSQLAHIVSSAYIKSPAAAKHNGFSAGSFRDMTRVAKLNPEMWTQLMSENADNLVDELKVLIENLSDYLNALKNNDRGELFRLLSEGNERKIEIEKNRGVVSNEDNG